MMMQTFIVRYFAPVIQPVANAVLDDSMQEYNQDLILAQGTEVIYWKLLEVNPHFLVFMEITKLKKFKKNSSVTIVERIFVTNCTMIGT